MYQEDYDGDVAVKCISVGPHHEISDFEKEIDVLSACNHVNIISLVGFCVEGPEKILVYEFMPNSSLHAYLHTYKHLISRLPVLERLEICTAVANGLNYLHSGSNLNIIHGDLRTDNIFLDSNFVPKLSKFGLSRTRAVQGTPGYIAPECFEPNYTPSRKADVYAFGVVLLEVLCERPASESLVQLALPYVMRRNLLKFTPEYVEKDFAIRSLRECEDLIMDCLNNDPNKRPSMDQVVGRLELALNLEAHELNMIDMDGLSFDPKKIMEQLFPSDEGEEEEEEKEEEGGGGNE